MLPRGHAVNEWWCLGGWHWTGALTSRVWPRQEELKLDEFGG